MAAIGGLWTVQSLDQWLQGHCHADYTTTDENRLQYTSQSVISLDSVPHCPSITPELDDTAYGATAQTPQRLNLSQPHTPHASHFSLQGTPSMQQFDQHQRFHGGPGQYPSWLSTVVAPGLGNHWSGIPTRQGSSSTDFSSAHGQEHPSPPLLGCFTQPGGRGRGNELPKVHRTIIPNAPVNPRDAAVFATDVDILMCCIQAKKETDNIIRVAEDRITREEKQQLWSFQAPVYHQNTDFHDCDTYTGSETDYFSNPKRAHTGDKPYSCKAPGCGQRFSQLGNLRTHERRHTGERPYECSVCGKKFAQRGNLQAHQVVHQKTKPFVCKLDNCYKQFTQRGNLKAHQNKYHPETLKALVQMFASITDTSAVPEEDKELWEYFATTYKNSNKGIKGRGKRRNPNHSQPLRLLS
ncbi:hypothetical protein SAPIO_CDS0292 [Scedosporium apiospermum]|uniref:C2H2-type domain-containing protein n=1 Tax=Pseudallescheria apiosperma TaxID=563466 RepID=A0A084GHY0_PSEDA|nr:uncharacterized protein SAPIO_CDS0292 [Scedosporium apiospermum]KEZ46942.1 hypothetical protein SAPIO_CDS0292 [Scedosporium apiospermum]